MVTAAYVLELDKPHGSHVNEYTCGSLCELFTHGDEAAIWPSVYFTTLRKYMAMFWPFGSNVQEHTFEKLHVQKILCSHFELFYSR